MKRLKLDSIVFLFIIAILGVANFANVNKPEISEMENRALKQRPKLTVSALFSGDYFRDYNEYYNDTFIFRDALLKASNRISKMLLIKGSDVKIIVSDKSEEYSNTQKEDNDIFLQVCPTEHHMWKHRSQRLHQHRRKSPIMKEMG